jgi:hypothetical protein
LTEELRQPAHPEETMRQLRYLPLLSLLLLTIAFVSPATADVIWGTVQHTPPSTPPGELAVLLTPGQQGTPMGNNVFTINAQTSNGIPVTLTTNNVGSTGVDNLYTFSAGELRSNPASNDDTSIDQLTISLPGNTFGDIYFNMFGMFSENHDGGQNTTASFVVTTNDGTFTHVYTGLTDNDTDNWIFLTTANGETIQSVSLNDTRFFSLQDLHVSEVQGIAAMPEPGTMLLLASGLSGIWWRRRK